MNLPEPIGDAALAFFQKLLGPVGEAGEFLTDKIRFYRWKSSLKTLEKAKKIAEAHNVEIRQLPLKFLVPFLEKSSLEEEDSDMASQWAHLLASALDNPEEANISLIDVLSKLGSKEVSILESMISRDRVQEILDDDYPYSSFVSSNSAIRFGISTYLRSSFMDVSPTSLSEIEDHCKKYMSIGRPNCAIEAIEFRLILDDGEDKASIEPNMDVLNNYTLPSYETLISLGLINRSVHMAQAGSMDVSVSILTPSLLAFQLVTACRGDKLPIQGKE